MGKRAIKRTVVPDGEQLLNSDRTRWLPRAVLWGLLDDKGKGCAKSRDGDPRQHGPRGISILPRKLEAEEKERRLDQCQNVEYRQQGYYDDHDQFCAARSKAASRPRQAHRQWAMKFGEAEPRYAPPKRC